MSHKTGIVEELGEDALILPTLVAGALQANDRAKYYMSLLLGCREHALNPDHVVANLSLERCASGEDDAALDAVIDGSRRGPENTIVIPQIAAIEQRLIGAVEQMCAPIQRAASDAPQPVESYGRRLNAIREQLPAIVGDTVPTGYVEALTRADRRGPDSVHLLVMDLHRELTRIQTQLAEQVIDGARTYALRPSHEPLVRSFMRGVNATLPLKFDHPGLDTTATCIGSELVIQNDLGTTDAHVIVIHVSDLRVALTYTDVHRARLEFFRSMFDRHGLTWDGAASASHAAYESCVGRRTCQTPEELRELLTFLGSRLVFLIDWNRARKQLSRFVKKADAVAALRWAADHNHGHRAFLETGGERLVSSVLERTPGASLRYGARLDEVLGGDGAIAFLKAVLRITSEGLLQRRSLRLIRDEVEAELLERLQDCEHGVLALAGDHAALIAGIAQLVQDALLRMRGGGDGEFLAVTSDRAKQWETKADDLVNAARDAERRLPASDHIARLLPAADDVADGLEEAMFLMAQLPRYAAAAQGVETLDRLTQVVVSAAQEYVKCVEIAREIRRIGTREDVQEFLIAVDRVITLEHESDEAERQACVAMLDAADNFRALHLLSQIAHGLEESVDALARCALMLKDIVIGEMLV